MLRTASWVYTQLYRAALPVTLCFVVVFAALFWADPAFAERTADFSSGKLSISIDSDRVIRNNPQPTTGSSSGLRIFFHKVQGGGKVAVDSTIATDITGNAEDTVQAIYGDTLTIKFNGDTLTRADSVLGGSPVNFVLELTNYGNNVDSIGFIVDTAAIWSSAGGAGSISGFSYKFFDSSGVAISNAQTSPRQETGQIYIRPDATDTVILQINSNGASENDTVQIIVTAVANNGTGKKSFHYSGNNGIGTDTRDLGYGGQGNDTVDIRVTAIPPVISIAKAYKVFAPTSYSDSAADTEHIIPGSKIVYTIWFDNEDIDSLSNIVIEDWIDTQFSTFDSSGITADIIANGFAPGNALGYGGIFTDSANVPVADSVSVDLHYFVNPATGYVPLLSTTPLADVSRIRWSISRPFAGGMLGPHNGNDLTTSADTAPIGISDTPEVDMGFVRFSVIVR